MLKVFVSLFFQACLRQRVSSHWAIGDVFLWHSPHGHPHWALSSKPGHRGARTFLNLACARSSGLVAITSPAFKAHNEA